MSNAENYVGATTTVVGWAASEARTPKYDKDGSSGVLEIAVPINEGYKKDGEFIKTGTTWYTYSAAGEYANALKSISKGDKVRIEDAKQEVREYQKDGVTEKAIGLRFGTITVLESTGGAASSDGFTPGDAGGGFGS